jgi:PPOX class probable FMN-dependent enzyme
MQKTTISSEQELRKIYGHASGRASLKVLTQFEKHAIHFINNSPFLVLSSADTNGKLEASPRGGQAGFVKVISTTELLLPDFKGNNRIDSLVNIVETGRAGLLFMIPGIDETLRVNGTATISSDPEVLEMGREKDKLPISCIIIKAEEIFLHCAKAFMRSDLWGETNRIAQDDFPSMGIMIKEQIKSDDPVESRSDMKERYKKDL